MNFESEEMPCSTLPFNPFLVSIFWLSVTKVISTIYRGIKFLRYYTIFRCANLFYMIRYLKKMLEKFINVFKRHHLQVNYSSTESKS